MPANYTHTTRANGTVLTATIYNSDHQNHIDNMIPAVIDDYSGTTVEMRTVTDPGEVGTENPATSLAGELERIRFVLKEMKGTTHWYESVSGAIAYLGAANTFTNLMRIVRSVAGNFFELESTEAGATSGPNIELYRNSASPAAADFGGNINFYFKDSAANKQFFGQIYSKMMDPTNGSEDGLIGIGTMRAGAQSDWAFESGTLRHVGSVATVPTVDGRLAPGSLQLGGAKVGIVTLQEFYSQVVGPQVGVTAQIPSDDTPPLIGEGTQLFSQAVTPLVAGSRIKFEGLIQWSGATAGNEIVLALFKDNTLIAVFNDEYISNAANMTVFKFEEASVDTAARTYSLRYGPNTAITIELNISAAGDDYGDKLVSNWTVRETLAV